MATKTYLALFLIPALASAEHHQYQIRDRWNLTESYTVTTQPDGTRRYQHDWDLTDSYTSRPVPAPGGGFSRELRNDWNLLDSYKIEVK